MEKPEYKKKVLDFILDDMTWSFSRINSFANGCPYCWWLTYVKKKKGIQNCFAEWGTFGHEILEKYAKNELEIYEMSGYYKDHYKENIIEPFPPNKYVRLSDSYYQSGLDYFNNFEGLDDYKVLGVEKEVRFKLGGKYNFVGYIDLLLQDKDNNIIVVDHKSKAKFKNKKEQYLYARQPYLYSIPVIEEYHKQPSKIIFNMFRKQHKVEIPFNNDDYKEAQEWALNTINNIYNCEDFSPQKDQFFCTYLCNHRLKCGALLEQ